MLAEAEKFAKADKEKRENIDLKNQAEALCFEAEKELSLLKDTISSETQENVTKLIETIRQEVQNNNFENLKIEVEKLKTAMKNMVEAKMNSESNSDPMSNLNDL
jgi:molecular chaperone DnaK